MTTSYHWSYRWSTKGKLERDQKLASKAKWMTSRGFVYPAPENRAPGTATRRTCPRRERKNSGRSGSRANCSPIRKVARTTRTNGWARKNFDSIPAFAREFGGILDQYMKGNITVMSWATGTGCLAGGWLMVTYNTGRIRVSARC